MSDDLTRYNLPLSRVTMAFQPPSVCAINCTSAEPNTVADYIRESLAENTRVAYMSDLAHFESWGGQIPAAPETIAEYLVAHADILSVATLNRRLAALSKVHRSRGFSNPTTVEVYSSGVGRLAELGGM
jgi:Phage integrase, N-terminal SAM-like domain